MNRAPSSNQAPDVPTHRTPAFPAFRVAARQLLMVGFACGALWTTGSPAAAAAPSASRKTAVRQPLPSNRPTIAARVKTPTGSCQFITTPNQQPILQCLVGQKVQWRYQHEQEPVGNEALLVHDGLLFAVRYATGGSGAVIDAYDLATGEKRWRSFTIGVGPVVHSAYENIIRARIAGPGPRNVNDRMFAGVPARLVIEGRETGGSYVEEFHAQNGQRLRLARHAPAASQPAATSAQTAQGKAPQPTNPEAQDVVLTAEQLALPWLPPPSAPPLGDAASFAFVQPPTQELTRTEAKNSLGLRCTAQHGAQQPLRCDDVYSKLAWQIETHPSSNLVGVAIAASDNVLVVGRYHQLATGVRVTGYDIRTGRELWTTSLYGLGPVDHSKWSNRIAVRAESVGKRAVFVISGEELSGKYVEVLDAAYGRTVGYQKR